MLAPAARLINPISPLALARVRTERVVEALLDRRSPRALVIRDAERKRVTRKLQATIVSVQL